SAAAASEAPSSISTAFSLRPTPPVSPIESTSWSWAEWPAPRPSSCCGSVSTKIAKWLTSGTTPSLSPSEAPTFNASSPSSKGHSMTLSQTTRRQLLQSAGLLLLAGPSHAAPAPPPLKTLVCVCLRGGLDGLSAVVPFSELAYYQARPTIA